jgi:hypothetical protein
MTMVEASVTGVFKMLLMIIGGMVLLRFIGQLLIAKRNLNEERAFLKSKKESEELRNRTMKNQGKITILNSKKSNQSAHDRVTDIEFEEVN